MKSLITLFVIAAAMLAFAQHAACDWSGTLKIGGAELRLVLHLTKSADGTAGSLRHSKDL